ncbi:AraC family transcriptional regulator ligand-binding domain-containing protein, partial [Aestuariivirga sp.]|uniref:AraC family transcriptional regulator ligand-binding domain-containing protein n=1 Tax=Aestuariivirga sp. TaxID=2650926 RepID=UPI0039196732
MQTRPAAMQRSGVLVELGPLLVEQGFDAKELFAGAGIGSPPLSPETRLPFAAALQVLERAAELTRCPHLGLVLGQRFQLAHHGALGELMRCAPTLGRALLDFTTWQPGYSSGAVVYLHRLGEEHAFGYGATCMGSRVLYDLVAAIGTRMLEQLTGGNVKPEEIHLSQRQPPDRGAYARYLGAPVKFNAQRVCLVLSTAALETRLPGADRARHQAITAELRAWLRSAAPDLASRTRHALRHLLQRGAPSMDQI